MTFNHRFVVTVLSLAGTLAAGAAQARPDVDVAVQIGGPGFFLGLQLPHVVVTPPRVHVPVYGHAPVYSPAPVYGHAPVYGPAPVYGHGRVAHGDRDRDGVPNRYDRVYNPRWDRDGDGVPNRYDRQPAHARGHHDRDRDGVPNWRDNRGGGDHGQRDGRRGGRD